MYGNIVSAVNQFLTPDLVAKMGSAVGMSDRVIAQNAVGAAVPAILSGLANLASKPEGARQVADAVAKQARTLETLANTFGGSGQLADTGKSLLSSLFGAGSFSGLANTIARFVGAGEGAMRSLLGMLAPVILGVLGRQAGTGASALSQLLASQKDNFAAAMPPGFAELLETSGFLRRTTAAAAAPRRASEPRRAVREDPDIMIHAVSQPRRAASLNWLYWVLPLLVAAGLGWYLLSGDRTQQLAPASAPQTASNADLSAQIGSAISTLSSTLQGVKDPANATAALPQLQQSATELDRLSGLVNRLPVETRDKLADNIKVPAARLKATLDNVNAMPVGPEVKPVIGALRTKLDVLLMTPGSITQQRTGAVADKAAYLARSPEGAVLVSLYFDRGVYNGSGEKVGSVTDLIVGPEGRIAAAVVGVGGFLGIGEKEVAVPFSAVQMVRRDGDWHLLVEATKDALKNAPSYEERGARRPSPPAADQK